MTLVARALVLVGVVLGLGGCGPVIDLPMVMGRPCAANSDCVPDGCCGRGTRAVHVLDGPDCSRIDCTGECPATEVNCGCGLPVCRESQCVVAQAVAPGC